MKAFFQQAILLLLFSTRHVGCFYCLMFEISHYHISASGISMYEMPTKSLLLF